MSQVEDHSSVVREGRVRCGDAFRLIEGVEACSVNLVVTSPPYWGQRTYGHDHDWKTHLAWTSRGGLPDRAPAFAEYVELGGTLGLEPYPHWYVAHLVEFFAKVRRVLADDGSLWVNLGDTYFARWSSIRDGGRQGLGGRGRVRRVTPVHGYARDKQLLMVPARFAIGMQEAGWILRNDVIWHKTGVPPRPEKDRLRQAHEHLFHFVKRSPDGRPKYYYDHSEVEPGGVDVVSCGHAGHQTHSATFPLNLIAPRIRSSCPPGGLVLDPFCGSGTSLVAAMQSGRRGLGFELSPEHAETARARVREL